MHPLRFVDQVLRCEQCRLTEWCEKYIAQCESDRMPEDLVFECPYFEPIKCYTIPPDLLEVMLAHEAVNCNGCVHFAGLPHWPGPICGENGPVGSGRPACPKVAIREDLLEDHGLKHKEDPHLDLPVLEPGGRGSSSDS